MKVSQALVSNPDINPEHSTSQTGFSQLDLRLAYQALLRSYLDTASDSDPEIDPEIQSANVYDTI